MDLFYPKEEVRTSTLINHFSREVKLKNKRFQRKYAFDGRESPIVLYLVLPRFNTCLSKVQMKCYYLKLFIHSPPHAVYF